MPFTKGDAKQFAVGLSLALGTALVFNFHIFTGVSLREVDWAEAGWDIADNLFQSLLTYLTAWWGITRSGLVRVQREVPANTVVPRTEPVIEQLDPPKPVGDGGA